MATRITLDGAPAPGEALRIALLAVPICMFGGGAFLALLMMAWAVVGLVVPPLAPGAVLDAHGGDAWPVWRTVLAIGALAGVAIAAQTLIHGARWRATHNRRSMPAMSAALRRHRRAGGWLIHRQRRGLLVLAAAGAYFPTLFALGKLFGPFRAGAAGPALIVAIFIVFLVLLATGVRLLSSDVPLPRAAGTALARWLLLALPFVVVMLLFLAAMIWLIAGRHGAPAPPYAGPLILIGLVVGMAAAFRLGARLESRFHPRLFAAALPAAREARAGDRRSPIVYLRSFGDDGVAVARSADEANWTRIEDVLADAARPYGPVIGIGRPGALPDSGAARAYFEGEEWRDAVARWVEEAQFVLIVAGYTSGVSWELETVLARGHAAKLIVVFPPSGERFAERWAWLRERARRFGVAFLPGTPVTGTLLVCLDRHGEELVMTSRKPTASRYRSALAIALVERFRL
jgi:hypothetical protein